MATWHIANSSLEHFDLPTFYLCSSVASKYNVLEFLPFGIIFRESYLPHPKQSQNLARLGGKQNRTSNLTKDL